MIVCHCLCVIANHPRAKHSLIQSEKNVKGMYLVQTHAMHQCMSICYPLVRGGTLETMR